MMDGRLSTADRWISRTTTASVVLLAGIAAVVSYRHMHALTLEHGESQWTAALIPLSVDGMIVASSMTLLSASRAGERGGLLAWVLLATGSAASLAANVAVAEPSLYGRVIAGWPSFALIGAYELLMRQVRRLATVATSDMARKPTAHGTATAGAPAARMRSARFGGQRLSGSSRRGVRLLDGDLLATARHVDAEHRARHGRPASAETFRVRLRIGSASARRLKDLVRDGPPVLPGVSGQTGYTAPRTDPVWPPPVQRPVMTHTS